MDQAQVGTKEPQVGAKKGKRSWNPGQYLDVDKKAKGKFRYRFVVDDPQEIRKRLQQGFVFVNPITGVPGDSTHEGRVGAEKKLDTTQKVRELVLMALPNEDGKLHDEWVNDQTRKQTINLPTEAHARFDGSLGSRAPVYGRTVIE